MDRETYERRLREHLERRRAGTPIVRRDTLGDLEEFEVRVLGGHLVGWLRQWGPDLLRERAHLAPLEGWSPDPLILFISSMSGLVAAEEILGEASGPVVWGLPADFESFPIADERCLHHVELRSRFEEVVDEGDLARLRETHPIGAAERYFVHSDESVLGPLFVRGGIHLWKWDGQALSLLEEGWRSFVS